MMDMNYKGTVMHIGAAPAEEQIYCYSTSDEAQERSCIGHLRGDFGSDGEVFFYKLVSAHRKNHGGGCTQGFLHRA